MTTSSMSMTMIMGMRMRMRMGSLRMALLLLALLLLAATCLEPIECQEQLTVESRQQKDNDDLTDTIKYLETLDKYFSQIARPRFGRSDYKQHRFQPGSLLLSGRLSGANSAAAAAPLNLMAQSNQPRFGQGSLFDLDAGRGQY